MSGAGDTKYQLWAEHEGVDDQYLGTFESLEDAARHVAVLEETPEDEDGRIPLEGCDVVAIEEDGTRWDYADGWSLHVYPEEPEMIDCSNCRKRMPAGLKCEGCEFPTCEECEEDGWECPCRNRVLGKRKEEPVPSLEETAPADLEEALGRLSDALGDHLLFPVIRKRNEHGLWLLSIDLTALTANLLANALEIGAGE